MGGASLNYTPQLKFASIPIGIKVAKEGGAMTKLHPPFFNTTLVKEGGALTKLHPPQETCFF